MKANALIQCARDRYNIDFAVALARNQALRLANDEGEDESGYTVYINRARIPAEYAPYFGAWLASKPTVGEKLEVVWHLHLLGQFVADGMKVIELDETTAEALRHMELRIKAEEYHQPFPLTAVQVGDDLLLSWWDGSLRKSVIGLYVGKYSLADAGIVSASFKPGELLEHPGRKLERPSPDDPDPVTPEAAEELNQYTRLCMNACLYATHHGLQQLPDTNPGHRERVTARLAKSRKRGDDHLTRVNEAELQTIPFRFQIDQRLPLYLTTKSTDHEPGEPTGRIMAPHWRRGHWRRQHHGPGNAQTKLIAIPAVLVNADLLLGDKANSRVTLAGS